MPFDFPLIVVALLFALAWVGHACLWTALMNNLYGRPITKRFLKPWRIFTGVMILAFPAALWYAEEWPMLAYLALCLAFGGAIFPVITVYRWQRKIPPEVMVTETRLYDFWKKLGPACIGDGKLHQATRLPFNDVFKFELTTMTVQMPQLPAAWEGLSILLISDTHFHGTPSREWFDSVFAELVSLPVPDLVLLGGDFVDTDEHVAWIGELFGQLKWKNAGFAILGNHDQHHEPERIRESLCKIGYVDVGNRWLELSLRGERCVIIGHEGPWFRPAPDLSQIPEGVFRLCLSHSPDNFHWGIQNGIDLMLCGHVHGGGIRVPLIGPIFTPSVYGRRYDLPAYKVKETLMILSRGVSGKEPIRLRCPPQVLRLILRRG